MSNISSLILTSIKKHIDNVAFIDCETDSEISYELFLKIVLKLIKFLKSKNLSKGDTIAICITCSMEYFALRIACILMGWCFVNLSEKTPTERLNYIISDCNVKLVFNTDMLLQFYSLNKETNHDVKIDFDSIYKDLDNQIKEDDKCFVIYTSGSTGKPKGIIHTYHNLEQMFLRVNQISTIDNNYIHAAFTSPEFVASVQLDTYPITVGAAIVPIPNTYKKSIDLLYKIVYNYKVNSMFMLPKLINHFANLPSDLKHVHIGGARAVDINAGDIEVVNGYGLSETGAFLYFKIDKMYKNTPVGKSLADEVVYLLDDKLCKVEKGEIYLAGAFLKEYINLPEQTKKAIVKNPYVKDDGYEYLFKTGDLATYDKNRNIVFLERNDFVVKINGQRVEPAETEYTLSTNDIISENVVKSFNTEDDSNQFLCAYYVLKNDDLTNDFLQKNSFLNSNNTINDDALNTYLKSFLNNFLPEYMVPAYLMRLDKLPVNINGKIDRVKLPNPLAELGSKNYIEPKTIEEKHICQAFEQVLKIHPVGIDDDFFTNGGDSLKAIELQKLLVGIKYHDIVHNSTPKKLAKILINNSTDLNVDKPAKEYTFESGIPLTEGIKDMAYDTIHNVVQYNNFLSFDIKLHTKYDVSFLRKIVYRLIEKHPILRARANIHPFNKQNWITFDGYPAINYFSLPIETDPTVCVLSVSIWQDVIKCTAHHIVVDAYSIKLLDDDLKKLISGIDIEYDDQILYLPTIEKQQQEEDLKSQQADKYLRQIYWDYDHDKLALSYNFKENAILVQEKLNIDTDKTDKFFHSHQINPGVFFNAVYIYTMMLVCKSNDIAYSTIMFNRQTVWQENAVGYFSKRILMRKKLDAKIPSEFINNVKSEMNKITDATLYNKWEIEDKYNIHSDFFFNFIPQDFINDLHLDEFTVNDNKSLTRDYLFTLYKTDEGYYSFTVLPGYSDSQIAKIFNCTFAKVTLAFINNTQLQEINMDVQDLEIVHNNYLMKNKDIDKNELEWLSNEICKIFKTHYKKINPKIDIDKININTSYNDCGGNIDDAILLTSDIAKSLYEYILYPVDVSRYKTPYKIAKQLIKINKTVDAIIKHNSV